MKGGEKTLDSLGLENGYTRIPNDLLENIYRMDFNSSQIKVLLCLVRNTYGYNRIDCNFSNSYVANGTGISKRRIGEVIKSLEDGNEIIVTKKGTFSSPKKAKINTNYKEWQLVSPKWSNSEIEKSSNGEKILSVVTNTSPVDGNVISSHICQEVANTSPVDKYVISTDDEHVTRGSDEYVTQKKKDIKKDINKNTMCKKEAFALFEQLWKLYPNKRGKGQVSEAKKMRLLDIGFEEMERAINRYKADLAENPWKKVQNGSTFFNSGYVDFLDKEWQEEHQQEFKEELQKEQEELIEEEISDEEWLKSMEQGV